MTLSNSSFKLSNSVYPALIFNHPQVGKGLKRIYHSEATKLDCPDFDTSSGIGSEESSDGPSYISSTTGETAGSLR